MSEPTPDPRGASSPAEPARADRRSFLDLALGGALAAWSGAIVYPVLRYLTPEQEALTASEVSLADGEIKRMERDGFAIVRLGSDRVIVFRGGDGALRALDAKCSHESCTVQYRGDEDCIWCACHDARFDVGGRVLSGPPPRPLAAYKIREAAVGGRSQVTLYRS